MTEPGVSYAIARLHQLVFAAVSERTARHGLTALQFTTLSVLNRHGLPLSNSQLARRSFMTAQSNHGRKLPARLTDKGRRVVVACEKAVAEFEKTMLKGLSRNDRSAFLRMLKSAVQNLDGGFREGASRK